MAGKASVPAKAGTTLPHFFVDSQKRKTESTMSLPSLNCLHHTPRLLLVAAFLFYLLAIPVASFAGVSTCDTMTSRHHPRRVASTLQNHRHRRMLLPHGVVTADVSSLWTAVVPVFDGSSIVDPVVVSNVFWANIQSKIVTLLIAQTIATVIFCIIAAVLGPQVTQWGDALGKTLRKKANKSFAEQTTPLLRKNSLRLSSIQPDFGKLLICVTIDILGSSSELVPIMGEATDILWAPVAGFILRSLYGSNILLALEFLEEILPFTDVLPLATITWTVDTFFADSDLARLFQVGMFHPRINGTSTVAPREERTEELEQRLLPGTRYEDEYDNNRQS